MLGGAWKTWRGTCGAVCMGKGWNVVMGSLLEVQVTVLELLKVSRQHGGAHVVQFEG